MKVPVLYHADNAGSLTVLLLFVFLLAIDIYSKLVPSSREPVPSHDISSSVQCTKTAIQIHNQSNKDWMRIHISMAARPIRGGEDPAEYTLDIERIPAGSVYQADLRQYHRNSGGLHYNAPDQFDPALLQPVFYRGYGHERYYSEPKIEFFLSCQSYQDNRYSL